MNQADLSHNLMQLANTYIELRQSNSYREFDKEFIDKEYNAVLVLSFLMKHGNAVVSHELAQAIVRSTPQMAVLYTHMEKQGYIERINDEKDARQTIVRITPVGEAFYKKSFDSCIQLIGNIFDIMGEERSEQFVASFRLFLQACSEVHRERTANAAQKRKESGGEG